MNRWTKVAAGFVLLLALAVAVLVLKGREESYATFRSPDQRFEVVVLRKRSVIGMIPGQSSDSPGRVLLRDRSGRVIREAPVEMVQLAQVAQWSASTVWIQPFGEWPLPADGSR